MNITRIQFLVELHEQYVHNLMCYSADFLMTKSRKGWEQHFDETKQKLHILSELLKESEDMEENK